MAITKEQIWAAADDLDASGQKPTLAAVRKAVGGGSFTTIQDAMKDWKARQAAHAAPAREPAPGAVLERLSEVGAEIWALAVEMAESRLAAEREVIEVEKADAEAARAEAAELADNLANELDEARTRLARIEAEHGEALQAITELRAQLTTATGRAEESERRALECSEERDAARETAAKLAGRLEAAEAQNAALLTRLGPATAKGTRTKPEPGTA